MALFTGLPLQAVDLGGDESAGNGQLANAVEAMSLRKFHVPACFFKQAIAVHYGYLPAVAFVKDRAREGIVHGSPYKLAFCVPRVMFRRVSFLLNLPLPFLGDEFYAGHLLSPSRSLFAESEAWQAATLTQHALQNSTRFCSSRSFLACQHNPGVPP